jgi:hypothetical protein
MAIRGVNGGINYSREGAMTTDPEEGRRQTEAMQPPALKVGDKVRLSAGIGPMTVVELRDYANMAVVEWKQRSWTDGPMTTERGTFPVRSLVRVD